MDQKPFGNTTDPHFYYMTDTACRAFRSIKQWIGQNAATIILSGDAGTGKTTLIQYLMKKEFSPIQWLFINQTSLAADELFVAIGRLLKISDMATSTVHMDERIVKHLKETFDAQKKPVLVIDEAQCLSDETLRKLFIWQTTVRSQGINLTIIFAGQTELPKHILRAMHPESDIKPFIHCRLLPMTFDQCRRMVAHRLKKAGYIGPALFSDQTLKIVYSLSHGVPRRVITICDLTIFTTVAHIGESITPQDVREISEYILRISPEFKSDITQKANITKTVSPVLKPLPLERGTTEKRVGLSAVGFATKHLRKWLSVHHFPDVDLNFKKVASSLWVKATNANQFLSGLCFKIISAFPKRAATFKKSFFGPWGWTVGYIVFIIGLGYAWLPTPMSHLSPHVLDNSYQIEQAKTDTVKVAYRPLPTKPDLPSDVPTVRNPPSQTGNLRQKTAIMDSMGEKEVRISEILAVPEEPISTYPIKMETSGSPILLAALAELDLNDFIDQEFMRSTIPKKEKPYVKTKLIKQPQKTIKSPSIQKPNGKKRITAKKNRADTLKNDRKIKKAKVVINPLTTITLKGETGAVRKALADGADPNAFFSKNQTALTAAIEKGFTDIAKLLIAHGARINDATPNGETALMKTAWKGNLPLAKELLNHNAQVNLLNKEGRTSLFYATIRGQVEMVDLLLKHGAKWNLTDRDGRTPLMAAAWNNHINIVQRLLVAGAKPNRTDRDGWTPLMFAAFGGHANVGKTLLSHGADPSLKNNSGQTSTDLATQQGHSALFALISDHIQLPQELTVID